MKTKNHSTGAFSSMKRLFSLSKTLSFRLLPVGKTEEYIRREPESLDSSGERLNAIGRAQRLDRDCSILKGAADRVHRAFIEDVLSGCHLKYLSDGGMDSIQEFASIFFDTSLKKTEKEKSLQKIADGLKKPIGSAFSCVLYKGRKDTSMLKALSGSLLLKEILETIELSDQEKESLSRLRNYTSYMADYCKVRDRMYKAGGDGYTIPNRIVNDNLPIHLNNVRLFETLPGEIVDAAQPLFESLAGPLQAYSLDDVFTPSYYSLLCPQSAIDLYNTLISGYSKDDGTKVKGLNELINEYCQQNPENKKIPKLKKLYKQILSEGRTLSWVPDAITTAEEVNLAAEGVSQMLVEFKCPDHYMVDPDLVLVNAKKLSVYSKDVFGDWGLAERCLLQWLRSYNPKKPREKEPGYDKRIKKLYNSYSAFSLRDIHSAIVEAGRVEGNWSDGASCLDDYYQKMVRDRVVSAKLNYEKFQQLLPGDRELKVRDSSRENAVSCLKEFLDDIVAAKKAMSIFTDIDGMADTDPVFYDEAVNYFREFSHAFVPVYNMIRNFVTKKPYSDKKFRVFFDVPGLLGGWDIDKERANSCFILREGDDLYLGVLPKGAKNIFSKEDILDQSSSFKKMFVKVIPKPHMMLPRVAFPEKLRSGACPDGVPADVWDLYLKSGKAVKDYTEDEVAMLIDYYKQVISGKRIWDIYNFKFKPTSEYERVDEFYKDVERQAYYTCFKGVSRPMVEDAVEKGGLYLFQITCQDMLSTHHGKDGKYKTLLFGALTGDPDADVRINGGGAIYFRPASLKRRVTHPAGIPIANKNPDSPERTRTLAYDLIKDRRYTEDQYQFHIPVTIYPKAGKDSSFNVNADVRKIIRENPDMYVLGINRGERNLVSIAVTAPDGTIVEQRNLNVFDNFNYKRKLAERERERSSNRRNWVAVKDIKNLKAGYLSRVVGEVASLVKKYNCVVAIERLGKEFKQSRRAFERNVYEQFERDLINTLSFLVDKNETGDRIGGALQLTSPGKSETDRLKFPQNGIVFLVSPSYISRTDPLTGFACRLSFYYESISKCEELMKKMDSFYFDEKKGRFILSFHYGQAMPELEEGDLNRVWNVETYGVRIDGERVSNDSSKTSYRDKVVNLTDSMKELFEMYGIEYADGGDLLWRLEGQGAEFWKSLMRLLYLTVRPTNWDSQTEEYRVIGCTANERGQFFDSRTAPEWLPKDGDTLAAWNIARKAHIILGNIRDYGDPKEKGKGPELVVSDGTWFDMIEG